MDAIIESGRKIWEGEIDFEGQRLVEMFCSVLLSTAGVLAFMVGFATQDITYTLYILLGGAALTFVMCVPPWPIYNKDPVKWLPAKKSSGVTGIDITVDGKKVQ
ncbi:hypothetical protein D6C91_06690 [Aureobasidium pullulans]|uniref:Signal peptidase complex subunit 1 n=1 Tax=Aureobasidium pullulans TaxID=5580 RepID=A0A4S9SUZ6_AURPU|nr:hypothetical protein D6C91_06690 [Aureobasidium pullulans]